MIDGVLWVVIVRFSSVFVSVYENKYGKYIDSDLSLISYFLLLTRTKTFPWKAIFVISRNFQHMQIWFKYGDVFLPRGCSCLPLSFPFQFAYQSDTSLLTATVTANWNDNIIGSVNFTLYKCALLATHQGSEDCSLCLTRDPRYR